MNAFAPSWTDVNPLSFIEAAKSGAAIGAQLRATALEHAARMAAIGQQAAEAGARSQQAAQELQSQSLLNNRKLDLEQQKMADDQAANDAANALAARGLDIKSAAGNQPQIVHNSNGVFQVDPVTGTLKTLFSPPEKTPSNSGGSVTLKSDNGNTSLTIPGENYRQYNDAQAAWQLNAPPKTIPGKLFGTNPNPAFDQYSATNPPPAITDFVGKRTQPVSAAQQFESVNAPQPMINGVPVQKDTSNFIGDPNGQNQFDTGASKKVATLDLIKQLRDSGMDKQSAAKWLQENGYLVP